MDRVERTIEIDAPVERVWSILTEPDAIAQLYAFDGAEVELRAGGALRFRWKEHGVFHGRVLRVEPPTAFAFRFASLAPGEEPDDGNSTVVEFTLHARGAATLLRVVESGFTALNATREEREQHARFSEQAWTVALDAVRRIGTEPAPQREAP